jgi:hypothetical protein
MVKKIILILLLISPFSLLAQNNTLTGNIFDNDNRSNSLEGASVKNITTKSFTLTDKDGHFAITAKIGDLISFGFAGFQTDTVYLTNLFPKNVYLRIQVNDLKQVDVNGAKVSPYLNTKDPNAMPARQVDMSKERGGVRLNLGYGKWRKEQAKIQELEENDKIQQEISRNFTEEAAKNLLKFEGPDVKDFLSLYRPTVDQVKADKPFNYTYYMATAYRAWQRLPVDQRKLPPLPKLKGNN